MANIRGFNDYRSNNNANNNRSVRGGAFGQGYRAPQDTSIPFFSNAQSDNDPRKENICDMFKFACCPQISWKQFIPYITIIDIVVFIVVLIDGGIFTPGDFLQPNPFTLREFGAKDTCLMYNKLQVYRFITPVFLHGSFLHIFFNMISQLIFGTMVENMIGTTRTIIVYFACAIGGNLFSSLVGVQSAVGASTAIAGLLGAYLGWLLVNWKALDYPGSPRGMMLCFAIMIIVFNLLFGLGLSAGTSAGSKGDSQIDNWGHLGGLLTGIFVTAAIVPALQNRMTRYEKKVKIMGWGLWIGFFIIGFVLFYTVIGKNLDCISF